MDESMDEMPSAKICVGVPSGMFPSAYSMPTQISAMMAITHSISMKPKSRCSLYE